MKVYIRTSKGDTDLLPDTVDCANRISNLGNSINLPFKLTAPGVTATKDGFNYTPWEGSNELYPSDLVFDLEKTTDDGRDSGNIALVLQSFDTGNPSRFSLVIDGGYYQNQGSDRCLDTSNFPGGFSYLTISDNPVLPSFGKWSVSLFGYTSSDPGSFVAMNRPIYLVSRVG